MSEFVIQVIEIGDVVKHENADTLSITHAHGGYPVIFRSGDYQVGDKAVYVPIDALVPLDDPRWEFLGTHNRIKAKRLRGVFSMGLLTPADPSWEVGQIVQDLLRIVKYEPPLVFKGAASGRSQNEHCPFDFPIYTDIEGYRRYPDILKEGEAVVLTEKIHGANGRFVYKDGRLWVGSHKCIKKEDGEDLWWAVAKKYDLATKLSAFPDIALYGEVYGWVQDLKYGANPGEFQFAAFDALNLKTQKYLSYPDFQKFAQVELELPTVPVLYTGPWSKDLVEKHVNGKSTIADHIREGFVARPIEERWDDSIGRVTIKFIGEDYLLRKEK